MLKKEFSIGAEEEFFLVDRSNKILASPSSDFLEALKADKELSLQFELFACQIETTSKVCHSLPELYENLKNLRSGLRKLLASLNADFVSASTFPNAMLNHQQVTHAQRYEQLFDRFAGVASNLLCNGMHIHYGCSDDRERVYLLNRLACFLPIFLGLSTSSPFFEGVDTHMQSHRCFLLEGLPLSGVPYGVNDENAYYDMIKLFEKIKYIDDPSNIYWHLRLNCRFPTLELRVCDAFSSLKDLVAVAALYVCLCVSLIENPDVKLPFYTEQPLHIDYYFWQVRRYSLKNCNFINVETGTSLSFKEVLETVVNFVKPVAKRFDCITYLDHLFSIVQNGTSADRQRSLFQKYNDFQFVISRLIQETYEY